MTISEAWIDIDGSAREVIRVIAEEEGDGGDDYVKVAKVNFPNHPQNNKIWLTMPLCEAWSIIRSEIEAALENGCSSLQITIHFDEMTLHELDKLPDFEEF